MRNNYISLFFICFLVLFAPQLWAQKLEAENATLSGGAAKVACSSCSGGFAVEQREGTLTFTTSIAQEGFFNIILNASSPGGEKTNIITVNGIHADFFMAKSSQYQNHKIVNTLKLGAGQHTIEIKKSWGWINVDYIELEKVAASDRFNLNQTLVTPNPTPEATALYNFLLDTYGDKIISGVMTLSSMDEVNWLKQNTGKEPALVGLDFMHSGRHTGWYNDKEPIQDAKLWYDRNGVPAMMWHWRDPSRITNEFYNRSDSKPEGATFDISRIADPNSSEYAAMVADIDFISGLLKELQDQNVPVLWRPLHEAAGGWFWWGAKGPEPLKALWQLMFDRMVNHHGLHNLIWVWTREPGDDAWYPGDEYVDIVGRDIYKDGDHSSHAIEFNNMNALYGGKKMIALSEVGSFPDVDNLVKDGAGWLWYMPWYGGYTRDSFYNSLNLWKKMFAHDYVLTLDEMPDLKTYERQDPVEPEQPEEPQEPTGIESKKHSFKAFPTMVDTELHVESEQRIKAVSVYNALGILVRHQLVSTNAAVVPFADLKPGLYIVKVGEKESLKVVKK